MKKFCGVMPALVTPLDEKEKLNVPVLHSLMDYLAAQGAYGFYVGGATGEGLALDTEVREELAYEAVKASGHKVPVIIHIASTNMREAIRLAKQAENAGADAISAIPPLFFAYDEDDVYSYYKELASSVHIPMMVYYNPAAAFGISADFAARLFTIENVSAIKWTSSDYYGLLRLKDLTHGEMNILNGPDEMLLMGLSAGADGGIGTTYNFQLPTMINIYESFRKGDIPAARKFQTEADRRINALLKYKCIPATKAVLCRMGFDVGDASFPMKRYTEAEKERIFREVMGI